MEDLKKLLLGTRIFDQEVSEENDNDEDTEDSPLID